MAEDFGVGIVGVEASEQFRHGKLLLFGARVGRSAAFVESALIADADAVGVVAFGVCSGLVFGAARVNGAVFGDVEVVADSAESARLMAGFERFHSEIPVCPRGGAVDNDKIYFSHKV